jgi:DNA-binding NarL/FixJ family response regulator
MVLVIPHATRVVFLRAPWNEDELQEAVCVGLPNRQIAARLEVAEGTVKTHLHRIYEKLDVRGRLELSLYGRANPP